MGDQNEPSARVCHALGGLLGIEYSHRNPRPPSAAAVEGLRIDLPRQAAQLPGPPRPGHRGVPEVIADLEMLIMEVTVTPFVTFRC